MRGSQGRRGRFPSLVIPRSDAKAVCFFGVFPVSSAAYVSTRGGVKPVTFREAVLMGLATDGGLLLPASVPDMTPELDALRRLAYPELAASIMRPFIGADIADAVLADLLSRSYASFAHPDVVPVCPVGPVFMLELFHGPTLAFKDVALQFLGNLFEHILQDTGGGLNILGATSGDTGSAAIAGVRGKANMHIFIMHPHLKVSPVQERQMTTVLDSNVHNIAVAGTFDDSQRVLKAIFNDVAFKQEYNLAAVNSVNWARILAQIVYYFHAAFRVCERAGCGSVRACVPTGNFGDIFAGYMAMRMGAPIGRLVLATNENDILMRFFSTGRYERRQVQPTSSPSMDIQVASNFERYLFYRLGEDADRLRELMCAFAGGGAIEVPGTDPAFLAGKATEAEVRSTIRRYYDQSDYLLDPHTAVGVTVAERFLVTDEPTVCLATAHPAKFGQTVLAALGQDVARHPRIEGLKGLPTRCTVLPADRQAVQEFIRTTLSE